MTKQPKRAAIAFIFVTLFIDILGLGIIIPILPELIKDFVGGEVSEASRFYGILVATYALMQFLFAPILGGLSDRFGRRPVLLLSLFGLGIDYIVLGLAPSLAWLFVGRVIAGVMGASITTANAYIADISTPENRAQNFGLLGVAFGLGFIFGPALGGVLGGIHIRLPFFVAAGLALLNWLYGFFILPESLPPENRSPFTLKKANPIASIGLLRSYPLVFGLAIAFFFLALAQRGLETVWVLYTGYRFGWSETQNGLALGLVGVMAALVQGVLIRPFIKRFGERRAIIFGVGLSVLNFALYGLSTQGWMMLCVIVFGSIAGVAGPAIQGLIAGTVSADEQGKVQGALTSMISTTGILAPLVFTTGLFSYFTSDRAVIQLPGAPFLLGAVLIFGAWLILFSLFRRHPTVGTAAPAESHS